MRKPKTPAFSTLKHYVYLMRLNKPIGILLLLWPTLWALWLASNGNPDYNIVCIFIAGVILMRSAGCIVNDIVDRKLDPHVARTAHRPLACKKIPVRNALLLALCLFLIAFILVLFCNFLTLQLAVLGVVLTFIYPFLKRVTEVPQLGLGIAFAWGVPIAFAAESNHVGTEGWFLFITAMIWPIIYDTMYAMIDREDDKKAGIKSAAILFAQMDRLIIGLLQVLFITLLIIVSLMFHLHVSFYVALVFVAFLFVYQQWLISLGDNKSYYKAFNNNNWVGAIIFLGIVFSYIFPVYVGELIRGVNEDNDFYHVYYESDKNPRENP